MKLIAYLPGISAQPQAWDPLIDKLRAEPELKDTVWLGIDHRCRWYSRRRFENFARDVDDRIVAELRMRPEVDEIILVGHSLGGQFARKAYMLAAARAEVAAGDPRRWDTRVQRIVLMASINRGIDPRRSWRMRWGMRLLRLLYPFLGRTIVFDLLPGASAMVTLRLEWMRHFGRLQRAPMIVQVLGRNDAEVSREDVEDTEQFPNAYHLGVPGANHVQLHDLDSTPEPALHYDIIRRAFVDQEPPGEAKPPKTKRSRVIFLLHGIRALSTDWPLQLEREVLARDPEALVVRPSTGYFTAFRFAVPILHQKALRWFQDEYGQLVAKYPEAEFHFVGHSNGTYLMAQSLSRIEAIRFTRVFLAGCVLPRDYSWAQPFKRGQVRMVRNEFSFTDCVVGLLCNALQGVGRKDVGTAGYESFTASLPGDLIQEECAGSGHGAAFSYPAKLGHIADFILGQPDQGVHGRPGRRFPRILVEAARFTWVFFVILLVGLIWLWGWWTGGLVFAGLLLSIAFVLTVI